MRKIRFITLGVILALLGTMVLISGCSTATTTTSANSSWESYIWLIVFIVIIFGLMYFFTIRPQRKKQQEMQKMLQSLQIGDKVITNGGIYATIQNIYADSFILKTDSGETMRVAKWAVVSKQPQETLKTS